MEEVTQTEWLEHLAWYGTYENRYNEVPVSFDPEPDKVILAEYTYEEYSGIAWAVWIKDGVVWENHGDHCSCYGLEGQWYPEELGTPEQAVAILEKRQSRGSYCLEREYGKLVIEELKK